MNEPYRTAPLFCLIEDVATRHALELVLNGAGYEVVSFVSESDLLSSMRVQTPLGILSDCADFADAEPSPIRRLHARVSPVPIIVLSSDPRISTAVSAIKDGAADFLSKPVTRDDLINSLNWIIHATAETAAADPAPNFRDFAGAELLTSRELDVLQDMVGGVTAKASALHLGIGFRTVESHRASIKRKLGVRSAPEAICQVYRRAPQSCSSLTPSDHRLPKGTTTRTFQVN